VQLLYLHVRSEASNDWLKLLSWLSGWLPEIGELLLVVAGFKERFRGASESLMLFVLLLPLPLLLVYVGGADRTEPFVEWAGNLITSTRSTESLYSFESVWGKTKGASLKIRSKCKIKGANLIPQSSQFSKSFAKITNNRCWLFAILLLRNCDHVWRLNVPPCDYTSSVPSLATQTTSCSSDER